MFKCLFILFCFSILHGDEETGPPAIGNFSLPTSQQPSGLFAFGGNIIDKGETQTFLFIDGFSGRGRTVTDLIPNVIYGITNKLSLMVAVPFEPFLQGNGHTSGGLGDIFPQVEYAFYNNSTVSYQDQATILGNITFPTGSPKQNPATGLGSPSVFLGFTFYRTFVNWFAFTGQGIQLMTSHHSSKNQYLYQFGIGRNMPSPKDWIFAWMIEVDGQYGPKKQNHKRVHNSSGGNIIYITPSLWFSKKHLLIQVGPSFPIAQHWYGKQRNFDIGFNFNLAWAFYPSSKK